MITPDPTGPALLRRGAVVVCTLAAVTALAACGSSSTSGGHSSTPVAPSSSASSSASASGSASSGQPADPATVAAVTSAYEKFFDSNTPEDVSLGLLQDGAAFKDALEKQASSPMAQGASATVSTVTLQSPNTAKVVFTILLKGSPVLKDNPGYAVRENGTWKVAGQTFCALQTLQGAVPPVCNTPAATSLPG